MSPAYRWVAAAAHSRRVRAGELGSDAAQRRYLDEDYQEGEALFPRGRYDEDRQQVDLQVRFTIIGAGIPNTGCGVMLQSYTVGGATLTRTN